MVRATAFYATVAMTELLKSAGRKRERTWRSMLQTPVVLRFIDSQIGGPHKRVFTEMNDRFASGRTTTVNGGSWPSYCLT
jgi:hypothetical protein